ncbi:MAG: phospho-sugar mutase [Clostridia bacterium]|nr:phospho-sugar mutase [Clostridia bacterium]
MIRESFEKYKNWRRLAVADPDLIAELCGMLPEDTEPDSVVPEELSAECAEKIESAFASELSFGTAGLRGVIGAGTDRMNIYTVARTSQGIADYIKAHYAAPDRKVAVSYDSRIKSELFARTAASVFAANGIKCYIFNRLMPTPCLSFAVRYYGCSAGVMITASHNPSKYNGYKVYGSDGCQITGDACDEILSALSGIDYFFGVKNRPFKDCFAEGIVEFVSEEAIDAYIAAVKKESLIGDAAIDRNIAIVYSPLHGTGLEPVTRILKESGFGNITVVKEQEEPDGNFTTCPYPNPEIREALSIGLEYADRLGAELMLATDPDADRVGIAIKTAGGHKLLTGNEVGVLLTDWICRRRIDTGRMPANPTIVKTIVTTDLADRVAESYGVRVVNVLTGFKYIGDVIASLEAVGHPESYILGFEESYGYLSGSYVRDKDAVDASLLICEMFAHYRALGMSLLDRLEEIYGRFGYSLNTQHSYYFEGLDGKERMSAITAGIRKGTEEIAGRKVLRALDYLTGIDGLPASDVVKFTLEGGCTLCIRPSGTEPKVKAYISVSAPDRETAGRIEAEIAAAVAGIMKA